MEFFRTLIYICIRRSKKRRTAKVKCFSIEIESLNRSRCKLADEQIETRDTAERFPGCRNTRPPSRCGTSKGVLGKVADVIL